MHSITLRNQQPHDRAVSSHPRSVGLRCLRAPAAVALLVLVLGTLVASAASAKAATRVFLNGTPAPVWFNDGDSFTVLAGPLAGTKARLAGYNTLESFGGVHQWGNWNAHELYVVAKMGTLNARRGVWHCHSDMNRDGYGRILWTCPDLIVDQIRKGLAHPMMVTEQSAPAEHIAAMKLAQAERRGIWAHGVPKYIVTSLHSNDEGYEGKTYNRLISTETGATKKWYHLDNYKECQWVCYEAEKGENDSCMLYVTMSRRYGAARAECLQH
jgi:hypothetical protein